MPANPAPRAPARRYLPRTRRARAARPRTPRSPRRGPPACFDRVSRLRVPRHRRARRTSQPARRRSCRRCVDCPPYAWRTDGSPRRVDRRLDRPAESALRCPPPFAPGSHGGITSRAPGERRCDPRRVSQAPPLRDHRFSRSLAPNRLTLPPVRPRRGSGEPVCRRWIAAVYSIRLGHR